MNPIRRNLRTAVGAVILAVAAVACAVENPTAPASRPNADLIGGLVGTVTKTVNALLFPCNTPGYGSASKVIGSSGGTIAVGPHSLVIPKGALSSNVTISATAPKGKFVEVDFAPEGLHFAKPATLTLSYAACQAHPLLPRIVYGSSSSILEILSSVNNTLKDNVSAKIEHFSGYLVAE